MCDKEWYVLAGKKFRSFRRLPTLRSLSRALGLPLVLTLGAGCLSSGSTTDTAGAETGGASSMRCRAPVDIAGAMTKRAQCQSEQSDERKAVYAPIDCNRVTLLSHAESPLSNNDDIIAFLKEKERFSEETMAYALAHPDERVGTTAETLGNPILERPIARAAFDLIRSAKQDLFIDMFLFGGTLGVRLAQEVLLASARGVRVVFLHDNESPFLAGRQMTPIWNALREEGRQNPHLLVLPSELNFHPSAYPFGSERLNEILARFVRTNMNPRGKSDHSKLIIADGFSTEPRMLVGSKNLTDVDGSLYFDESALVEGPAAAASLLAFRQDVVLAYERARREQALSPEDAREFEALQRDFERMETASSWPVAPKGEARIRLTENNARDDVRNVEQTLLALFASAKESIDIYEMLAYHPEVARGLALAMKRGVRVRVLLGGLGPGPNMNTLLAYLMMNAGIDRQTLETIFRVRTLIPGTSFPESPERLPIPDQQQHTKTVIVDQRAVLLGSANFDSGTLSGGFREFSVVVEEPSVARQASANFNVVFGSDAHSTPLGQLAPLEPPSVPARLLLSTLELDAKRIRTIEAASVTATCLEEPLVPYSPR